MQTEGKRWVARKLEALRRARRERWWALDGRLARAAQPTRLERDLEGLVDWAFAAPCCAAPA